MTGEMEDGGFLTLGEYKMAAQAAHRGRLRRIAIRGVASGMLLGVLGCGVVSVLGWELVGAWDAAWLMAIGCVVGILGARRRERMFG